MFTLILAVVFSAAPYVDDEPTAPPAPTRRMVRLVDLMGDDNWYIREAASKEMERFGLKSLAALEFGMRSEDLEVRMRCRKILEVHYEIYSSSKDRPIPSIWFLPEKYRFIGDRDVALELYSEALEIKKKRDGIADCYGCYSGYCNKWADDECLGMATVKWRNRMVLNGMTPEKVKRLLDKMCENMDKHYLESPAGDWDSEKGKYVQPPPGKMVPYGR